MHVAEGILSPPVMATGAALAAAGVGVGLWRMRDEEIPRVGIVSAALFVAGLIQVPAGPASVHLTLIGLSGVMLGWAVFPAMLIALLLQAVMLGIGGVTALGVNTVNMAVPAVICGGIARLAGPVLRSSGDGVLLIGGALIGGLGMMLAAACFAASVVLSGDEFSTTVVAVVAMHVPLIAVECLVTGSLMVAIRRLRPELLWPRATPQLSGASSNG